MITALGYELSLNTIAAAVLAAASSYGAIAALLTVLERPGIFGRLLLESPSAVGSAWVQHEVAWCRCVSRTGRDGTLA